MSASADADQALRWLLVAGSWWLFEWELTNGANLAEARTAAMNLFVVVEAFYLFSCRSLT